MGSFTFISVALLAIIRLAAAHFALEYPIWRTDTLSNEDGPYSQWTYPCAGVPSNLTNANRTDWPLDGGSIELDLHHPWTYIFINLGLGVNSSETITNFNYSLTPEFLNSTGKGNLCISKLPLPADLNVTDGTFASIQVVTLGETGTSLYNCADITFRANATILNGDACKTDDGVSYVAVKQQSNDTATNGTTGTNSTNSTSGGSGENAGSAAGVSMVALSSVVGLAVLFCLGIGA